VSTSNDTRPDGIDRERLRRERLARCLAEMAAGDLDALVLGREGNVRYVSDARRLWLAGPRPFGPGCVVVRATGDVHLLSTSSEGVPPGVPSAHLYALTWNPAQLAARLARIPGLAAARTIGVDGWNPAAARLLAHVAPAARLGDGDAALRRARTVKTGDEVACIRAAADVAQAGLAAARERLGADVTEPTLRGAFLSAIAARAVTIPSFDGLLHPAVRPPLAALRCGVLRDGYEATLIRTYALAPDSGSAAARALAPRAERLCQRLVAACRVGAGAAELLASYAAAQEALPPFPIAHGVGLGCEPPLLGRDHVCDAGWRIEAGMVLALYAFVTDTEASYLTQDLVHVTADGAVLLTAEPRAPLAT